MTWTKPFYGVQHLIKPAPAIRQITVTDRESFAEVWALGPSGFTPMWEECHDTATGAREAGEKFLATFLGKGVRP